MLKRFSFRFPFHFYLSAFVFLLLSTAPRAAAEAGPEETWRHPRLMLTYDTHLSPAAGADNLLTAYYTLAGIEDRFLKPKWTEEDRFFPKCGGIVYRMGKLVFIDYPLLAVYADLFQHEVFGHGYRAREFGYEDIEYQFGPPFTGGGQTSYHYPGSTGATWDQDIAMAAGGVEANAILAGKVKQDWLRTGNMEYRGALLYILATNNFSGYIAVTDENELAGSEPDLSNDMLHYVSSVNRKQGETDLESYRVRLKDLEQYSAAPILDPYYWYAFWTLFKTHLWSGSKRFGIPAIPLGPVRYLPSFNSMLTPWGPEFRFENLLAWNRRTLIARYRIGDDAYRSNWGADLEASEILTVAGASLDAEIHFWKQPRLKLDRGDLEPAESRFGTGQSLTVFLPPVSAKLPIRLAVGGDFKTSGFLPGAKLDEGFSLRLSAAWFP